MDTIGDAYIVAGLLPSESDLALSPARFNKESARVCNDMLEVASAMIQALAEHRSATGQDVDGRIGISVGMVVAGVLGRLQPRFHIHGPGMRAAEMLEQTGCVGAAHVSDVFLRTLWASNSSEEKGKVNVPVRESRGKLWPHWATAPDGWRIGNVVPRLGITSPKHQTLPRFGALNSSFLISQNGCASPSSVSRARTQAENREPAFEFLATTSSAGTSVERVDSGGSGGSRAEINRDLRENGGINPAEWTSPMSKADSPVKGILRSPHLSEPNTPPTPSPEPRSVCAEVSSTTQTKNSFPLTTPKSTLRHVRLQFWRSGRGDCEGGQGWDVDCQKPNPLASASGQQMAKGTPLQRTEDSTASSTKNNAGVSPAASAVGVRSCFASCLRCISTVS